jgi:hypothetical protein
VPVWLDNRNPGRGFDLFAGSVQYTATSVEETEFLPLNSLLLKQSHPNPFNSATTISYRLTRSGRVRLEIFNIIGQSVKILVNRFQTAGVYREEWSGVDSQGKEVAGGVYFYRLKSDEESLTKKMILLK